MNVARTPSARVPTLFYNALPWQPVESSNIDRVAYVDATLGEHNVNVLFVEFSPGRIYRYDEVPKDLFEEMLDADSVGQFFATNIRDEYDTTRLIIS